MEKTIKYPVTALRICINSLDPGSGEIQGIICGIALECMYPFCGSGELLLLIDKLLDQIGKPQASRKVRSFKSPGGQHDGGYKSNPVRYHESEEIAAVKGSLETKDVFFISRFRSTWQGIVKDQEGNSLGRFNSDLEFLDLLFYD